MEKGEESKIKLSAVQRYLYKSPICGDIDRSLQNTSVSGTSIEPGLPCVDNN